MEVAKVELAAMEATIAKVLEPQVKELAEFELCLAGGGLGDVHLG
jgi:hypothetical protein